MEPAHIVGTMGLRITLLLQQAQRLDTVTGTDANGCQNTDQVTVTVNALPTVSAGADQDNYVMEIMVF